MSTDPNARKPFCGFSYKRRNNGLNTLKNYFHFILSLQCCLHQQRRSKKGIVYIQEGLLYQLHTRLKKDSWGKQKTSSCYGLGGNMSRGRAAAPPESCRYGCWDKWSWQDPAQTTGCTLGTKEILGNSVFSMQVRENARLWLAERGVHSSCVSRNFLEELQGGAKVNGKLPRLNIWRYK